MTARALLAAATLALAAPAFAASLEATRIGPSDYQSFVANWSPPGAPLCAAIASADQWNTVFRPAAVMGQHAPYAPDAGFWQAHMILMVARVIPGAEADAFGAATVSMAGGMATVRYAYRPPRPAGFVGKSFLAFAVPPSQPATVSFVENGRTICTLHPAAGVWVSPRPTPAAS